MYTQSNSWSIYHLSICLSATARLYSPHIFPLLCLFFSFKCTKTFLFSLFPWHRFPFSVLKLQSCAITSWLSLVPGKYQSQPVRVQRILRLHAANSLQHCLQIFTVSDPVVRLWLFEICFFLQLLLHV